MNGLFLLFYCFFGHLATDCYLNMADCLYDSEWYKKPLKLQKYYLLTIQNAQKPCFYHGFGMATLNLNTYGKVCILSKAYTAK